MRSSAVTPPSASAAPAPPPATVHVADGAARLPSAALLQGRRVLEISHNGAVYRLQATRQGKLILTK